MAARVRREDRALQSLSRVTATHGDANRTLLCASGVAVVGRADVRRLRWGTTTMDGREATLLDLSGQVG